MVKNDVFTDKILDRLKYLNGIDVHKKDDVTYLCVENINFAALKNNTFYVKKTDRSSSMLPLASIEIIESDTYLKVDDYGNRIVDKELCEAVIKDLEDI